MHAWSLKFLKRLRHNSAIKIVTPPHKWLILCEHPSGLADQWPLTWQSRVLPFRPFTLAHLSAIFIKSLRRITIQDTSFAYGGQS